MNQCSDQESLLHLRLNLTSKARDEGIYSKVAQIYDNLRSRFGLTTKQARDKLGNLKISANKNIHELGSEILRLVKLSYTNMPDTDQDDLAMDKFTAVMNDTGLKRHVIALRPESIKDAVQMTEEYIQVDYTSTKLTAITVESSAVLDVIQALQPTVKQQADLLKIIQERQRQIISWQNQLLDQAKHFAGTIILLSIQHLASPESLMYPDIGAFSAMDCT